MITIDAAFFNRTCFQQFRKFYSILRFTEKAFTGAVYSNLVAYGTTSLHSISIETLISSRKFLMEFGLMQLKG